MVIYSPQTCALDQSTAFLDRLVRVCELQLLQYDDMMVIDDVIKGSKYTHLPLLHNSMFSFYLSCPYLTSSYQSPRTFFLGTGII